MKKKSLLLSLACAMLVLLFGMTANAQSEDTLEPYSYTNPAYANLESDTDSASDSIAPYSQEVVPNASYTSDVDALAGTLRQQMVSRAAVINLYYHHDSVLTQAVFDQLCDDLFAKAIAHTGVGKEGDYILWNCQRYTVGATQEASSQGSGYDVHITFTFTYLTDASQEAEVDQAVANLLKTLDLSGKTDYQKIKAIYDYICSNITYDYDNLYDDSYTLKHSSYAALINKKAVCQGYASLFYRLALEAGIDARVISGDSNGPHAWNIVKIEGSYYNLDSTWDAGNTEYEYFLKNAKDFPNHTRDAAYTTAAFTSSYPIAATSYAVHGSIQDYEYKITNNGQVIITKYTGNDADVTTPATIADMPVIGIDKKAFFDLPNLETRPSPKVYSLSPILSQAMCLSSDRSISHLHWTSVHPMDLIIIFWDPALLWRRSRYQITVHICTQRMASSTTVLSILYCAPLRMQIWGILCFQKTSRS